METHAARTSSPDPLGPNNKAAASAWPLLTPTAALRILCRRTGARVSLTTLYRWINSGRVGVVRMGYRILIPLPWLEDIIKRCLDGERV